MSFPEPPIGISSVDSFPVWSGGSLIIFQVFRCRNLSLNSIFLLYLRGRHFSTLRGVSVHPIHSYAPCTFVHPLDIWTIPICSDTPICPPFSPVHLYVQAVSTCDMGMGVIVCPICSDALPYIWMPLVYLDGPNMSDTPLHMSACPPVPLYIFMCLGVSACDMGDTLYVGVWGASHILGSGGISKSIRHFGCLLCSCYTFLVDHHVSSLYYHGYDYYFSGECGVFWYVISFIRYHGSLFDGTSCNIESA